MFTQITSLHTYKFVVSWKKDYVIPIPSHTVEDTVRSISETRGLTTLRLSGNSMGVQAAESIAGALAQRPSLRRALWSDMFVGDFGQRYLQLW